MMTPEQKIKHKALSIVAEWRKETLVKVDESNVDELYEGLIEDDEHYDAIDEIRCSGIETGLPCNESRQYESESVAAKMLDGTWVGWVYWYGGGKFGLPENIDWMSDAYELECTERQEVVIVQEFKVKESE